VIEGMLGRAGPDVNRVDGEDGFTACFICTKIFGGNQIVLKCSESMVYINSESEMSHHE
jgi:hypothetical protein